MRCTGERDLFVTEAERLGSTGLNERQDLHRLKRRARINWGIDVAERRSHRARCIEYRDCATMDAFDNRSPREFNESGIRHQFSWDRGRKRLRSTRTAL